MADLHIAGGVAGVLGEAGGRAGADDGWQHAAREAHPLALHVGAGLAKQALRLLVLADLEADLLQDGLGMFLEPGESLLAEQFEGGDSACDVGGRALSAVAARLAFRPARPLAGADPEYPAYQSSQDRFDDTGMRARSRRARDANYRLGDMG